MSLPNDVAFRKPWSTFSDYEVKLLMFKLGDSDSTKTVLLMFEIHCSMLMPASLAVRLLAVLCSDLILELTCHTSWLNYSMIAEHRSLGQLVGLSAAGRGRSQNLRRR